MASTSYENGIVFVNGDVHDVNKQCWSTLGRAPNGYTGTLTKTLADFGAPPKWQVIVLSKQCGGDQKNTIQHEVGHAIGRFHEFQRPDRDDKLIVSTDAAEKMPAFTVDQFQSYNFPFDIASTMMYCSQCITKSL